MLDDSVRLDIKQDIEEDEIEKIKEISIIFLDIKEFILMYNRNIINNPDNFGKFVDLKSPAKTIMQGFCCHISESGVCDYVMANYLLKDWESFFNVLPGSVSKCSMQRFIDLVDIINKKEVVFRKQIISVTYPAGAYEVYACCVSINGSAAL